MASVRPVVATAVDGTRLMTWACGAPARTAIVMVHGFAQGAYVWRGQHALGHDHQVVSYDLRGHGGSDKPTNCNYRDPNVWAGDLAAVLDAHELEQVVLVGWSYGGRVLVDYMTTVGDVRVAGLAFVGSLIRATPEVFGPGLAVKPAMLDDDPYAACAATATFTANMFHTPQPIADTWAALSMATPTYVRRAMDGRPLDATDWAAAYPTPVWVAHGTHDQMILPDAARHTHAAFPHVTLSCYAHSGHCPFWEEPEQFNAELGAFANRVLR